MEKSRTRQFINNMSMSFLNQFTTLIFSFISRTIFIRVLGVDLLGVNGLFTDVLGLLSMADLGFNTAMVYSFYKPIAENDTKKISSLISFYKKIYNTIAIVITVIGLAVIPFLDLIVRTEKDVPYLEVYYLFALAGIVVSYLFVYKTSIITANQQNYIILRINMIMNLIKTIVQIIVLLILKNFMIYLAINLICNLLSNFITSRKAIKLYPYIKEKNNLELEERKSIFENIKSIFLYKVSGVLLNCTDNTLISILIGTSTVGYYSNYLMISNKVTFLVQLIFGSLTASVGNLIVKEEKKKRYEIFKATQSVSFIISGIIVICYTILINDLIKVWLGKEFTFSFGVVLTIALNLYLVFVLQPLFTYREATGMYMKTKYIMVIAAIINLFLSIIMGKLMGIGGIFLASVISRLSTYFWYEPLLLFKDYLGESVKKFFIPILINFITIIGVYIVMDRAVSLFVVTSWGDLIIKAGICGSITSIIFLLLYSKSSGVKIILKKLNLQRT